GLGQSFARLLLARTDNPVIALTHSSLDQVKHALLLRQEGAESKLTVLEADITKEVELKRAAEWVKERYGRKMGMLCNFAGVLYPEKNIASMELDKLQRTYEINTFGHALMFKHFLPLVPRASRQEREEAEGPGEQGRSVLVSLSAKVGSIEDNRTGGWYSYRSSKAATNQLVRTVAREVEMRNVWATVIAYHPGTVRTGLAAEFVQGKSGKGIHDAEKVCDTSRRDTYFLSPKKILGR
ncbi:NADP-binding protein, partial [Dacryopinax primogenitus]